MTTTQPPVRPVRVLIADDHAVVRAGLAALFGMTQEIEVLGAAVDGAEAVWLALQLQPDVVIMKLSMPGIDGTEATRQITASGAITRVIALTSFSEWDRIIGTFDARLPTPSPGAGSLARGRCVGAWPVPAGALAAVLRAG